MNDDSILKLLRKEEVWIEIRTHTGYSVLEGKSHCEVIQTSKLEELVKANALKMWKERKLVPDYSKPTVPLVEWEFKKFSVVKD